MIKQLHALPPVGLGLIPELEAPFMKDPASLKYGQKLPEFEKAKGPPSNAIFEIKEIEEGSKFTFPYKDGTRTVQLQRILFRSHGIIGRGTIVVRVVCACTHCVPNQCDWSGKKLVLKLSFPSVSRVPEQAFMDRCKEKAKGEHAWVLNHLPDIYCSFDIPCGERSPQANFKKKFEDKYEMRFLRGSIQDELQPLSTLETALECAQVFYDIVQCHHWVHTYPRILHRDISDGNIMVRVKDGKKYGVLNDWDLAMWLDEREGISTSQFRTGTRPYMAHEQHSPDWEGPHRYRHDMESLFYVILLLATLFSNPCEKDHEHSKKRQPYTKWFTQGDEFLYDKKALIIFDFLWQPIPNQFFSAFHQWLKSLQRCLYVGFTAYKYFVELQSDTPNQVLSFNDDTLDDHFSYDKFVLIMHRFSEEDLATHGSEWQGKLRGLQKDEDERKK
ncbi:kinase-like domain-containing protein [Lentinula lateritia]|uniref:Kinase-like domain-containing protein n=1 Tax=Lentinula lateritia TaxID=40482 RepID=A0ABQ8VWV0_9AGAR|nr:kinase-like domain-containing protein [Lentinula lateritia]